MCKKREWPCSSPSTSSSSSSSACGNKNKQETKESPPAAPPVCCCRFRECGRKFSTTDKQEHHNLAHNVFRPYTCDLDDCPQTFSQRSSAVRHYITVHEKTKSFKCHECGKAFGQSCHLKQHFLRHTDQKPFQCTFCPSSFRQRSTLYSHMKSHEKKRKTKE